MSTVFWAIVVLGILIFVHELGHFLVARWMGVKVLRFSLGFGPTLWSRMGRDGTEYALSAVPLGGYVKMLGETDDEEEPVPPEELPYAFGNKPVGPRFAIVFAGPLFNFLFAMVVLSVAFMVGVGERLPVVGGVSEGMPAQAAGILEGDRITHIDGHPISRWNALSDTVRASGGRAMAFTIERGEARLELVITPQLTETKNIFGEPVQAVLIGVSQGDAVEMVSYGPLEAIGKGVVQTWRMVDLTLTSIWKLLTRVVSADQIGGPLLIAELAGKTASQGATSLLFFMALISVNLGILNLLPIPILDGGHLMFFAIEAVKGSPVDEGTQALANRIGMAILGALMILAFYNDLARYFSGGLAQ